MEEIIFKPRYSISYWIEVFISFFWAVISGLRYFLYPGPLLSWWLPAFVICTGIILFVFSHMIKRIIFQQNALVIEYYFRPQREVEYQEISDISEDALQAGKFHLRIKEFMNRKKLLNITVSLKKSGRIIESQLDGKLKKNEETAERAGAIGILIAILILMTMPFILTIWFPQIEVGLGAMIEFSLLGGSLVALVILKIFHSRESKP